MPLINFVNEKRQIEVPEGSNLRRAALDAGVPIYPGINKYVNCMGFGHCGTCAVLINKGAENASRMRLKEKLRLWMSVAFIGNEDKMRLACQTRVEGDMDVQTRPAMNWTGENFFS